MKASKSLAGGLALVVSGWSTSILAASNTEIEQLRLEIKAMREHYEQRINELEGKLGQLSNTVQQENTSYQIQARSNTQPSQNAFNPQLSIIVDGQASSYKNNSEAYELPGFALGGEAGLPQDGMGLGHTEITASSNIDDKFYGQITVAIADHEGETETELEEAFFETLGLGNGLTLRGGRFFSAVGYINQQHNHAWDFADAPLIYTGIWGKKYIDNGVRLNWIAPTDLLIELGAEIFSGGHFPAGGEASSGSGSQVYFMNLGGDIGISNSWQIMLSHYTADVRGRETGGHHHGGHDDDSETEVPVFTGDSDVDGIGFVYKWAPDGNFKDRNFKLQGEYFSRDENGLLEMSGSIPLEETTFNGDQQGYYLQGIYQFLPQWRMGIRYDWLHSNNSGLNMEILEEAGLTDEGINPERWSTMLEWIPSEFSRVRLQFNHDKSYEDYDNQIFLQYTMSLGAHGAHQF